MALRFQRRIRLLPGLHLTLSKGGLGLSAGPRGAKVSLGRQGIYGHLGLPGTGLSSRQKLSGRTGVATAKQPRTRAGQNVALHVQLSEPKANDGTVTVTVTDEQGQPFSPADWRVLCAQAGEPIRQLLQGVCQDLNRELAELATLHWHTLAPREQPLFIARPWTELPPARVRPWRPSLWQWLWPPARTRGQRQHQQALAEYGPALAQWQQAQANFQTQEQARQQRETQDVFHCIDSMAEVLSDHLAAIPWPRATLINFDLGDDASTIAIDIELPQEQDFPSVQYQVTGALLTVSSKALSATRRRELYRDYAHAVAMRVLGEIYHRLPQVNQVRLSAYRWQLDAATGHQQEGYLYSVGVARQQWCALNFDALNSIDPVECLARFRLRRQMSKTGLFNAIEPWGLND